MKKIRFVSMLIGIAVVFTMFSGMAATSGTEKYTSSQENSVMEFFVATDGDDSNAGTIEAPFKTLEGARNAIRKIKTSQGLPDGNITVYIRGGYYQLTQGFRLESRDSGNENCTISYCAYGDEDVVVSGGIKLDTSKFKKVSGEMKDRLRDKTAKNKVLVLDLTAQGVGDLGELYSEGQLPAELFKNGTRMTLARYPNDGFTSTLCAPGESGAKKSLEANEFGGATCYYSEKDSVIDKWTGYEGVFIVGYLGLLDYSDCVCPMMGLDVENHCFEIGPGSGDYICYKNYFFLNVYDEIDTPGEYYIDRENGKLYVYPTDDLLKSELVVSQCTDTLVTVESDYTTIKGLHIEAAKGSAMSVSGKHITIDGNRITGIGRSAMHANGTDIYIINNYIDGLGYSGITFRGGNDSLLEPSRSYIDNNTITNFAIYGRTYNAALDIIGNGVVVSHNEIAYAPHEAIEYSGQNIIFEYNRIHDVCLETGDAGAIYSGRTWTRDSCIIRYNYIYNIHDVMSADDEGNETGHPSGIYWDDALSGQIAYGNILYDLGGNGFLIGGGHHNVVYNNIIIAAGYLNDADDSGKVYAINYDARASSNNWASRLAPYENMSMWGGLSAYPYTSKLWEYKFPILALLKETSFNNSMDPDVGGNNAYAIVRNNIIVEKRTIGLFEGSISVYSTIRDNVLYKDRYEVGFVDVDNMDLRLREDSRARFDLPYFEELDCSLMGLRK